MRRVFPLTLLVLLLLVGMPIQAQRSFGGGMSRGFGRHSGFGVFFGPRGLRSGFFPRHFRSHGFGNPGLFVGPLWYDGGFGYDGPYEPVAPAPTPIIVTQQPQPQPAPVVASPPPKIIEIPGVASAATSQPNAVFVLSSGERIEASRYLLTADHLQITTGRQQRTIPLSQLDMNATLSANHERGIALKIPNDRNEITLAF